ADKAQMKKLAKQTFELDGDTVDQFMDELYSLGKIYTGETEMSAYVDEIYAAKKAAAADPIQPAAKVALILPGGGSEHMIAGTDSFYADEIRCATGNPVGPKGNKFVTLNAESLIQMNPDVIVVAGNPASFLKDPRFKSLSAIQKKRVLSINQDSMLRRGSRVASVIDKLHDNLASVMQ
ncbi:MAG: iron complex transport system substrate-binding protein, partial [Fimbriimonadaceae bacterium]|nr:iron complex transport system substrate-binding protein [Fimbriimonadaceae bacterium]